MGPHGFGVDPQVLMSVAEEVAAATRAGVKIAIVVSCWACVRSRFKVELHCMCAQCERRSRCRHKHTCATRLNTQEHKRALHGMHTHTVWYRRTNACPPCELRCAATMRAHACRWAGATSSGGPRAWKA